MLCLILHHFLLASPLKCCTIDTYIGLLYLKVDLTAADGVQGEKRDKKTIFLASDQSLSYLDGSLAADYGFDPLGLMDPEGAGDEGFISPPWLVYGEIYNARWAMLGVVGCLFPEVLAYLKVIPQSVDEMTWFRSGVYPPAGTRPYWTGGDP